MTEADTCRKFVVPALQKAGWDDDPHSIAEQRTITDGRIAPVGKGFVRKPPKRADFLLYYERGFPLAVVEAKAAWKTAGAGLQQAKDYAELLGLPFAYATNGIEIIEFDYLLGRETVVTCYPTPDELWARYRFSRGILDDKAVEQFLSPINSTVKRGERYYAQILINRSVEGIILGIKRQLLTLATGTGKTAIAFQSGHCESESRPRPTMPRLRLPGGFGEFYTPRPVVRFMVEAIDPRLGELVEDPAAGTGGFIVKAFTYLAKQVKTVNDRKILQTKSVQGGEPKSLSYLLWQMNLLLHGLNAPRIDPGNSLRNKLTEIGDSERVDVVLTNPPVGGAEEKGIQDNSPGDKRTAETAMLFLQLIMRKLRRGPKFGRAAVVVPNGTLFGDGVCARIKEDLLKEFNLHTIVRLPNGTFAPYTGIPTNTLFLDRKNPSTKEDITHLPPEELTASILEKERRIAEIVTGIQNFSNHEHL